MVWFRMNGHSVLQVSMWHTAEDTPEPSASASADSSAPTRPLANHVGQEEKVQCTNDSNPIPSQKLHMAQPDFRGCVLRNSGFCLMRPWGSLCLAGAVCSLNPPPPWKVYDGWLSVHMISDNRVFNRPRALGSLSGGCNNQDQGKVRWGKCLLGCECFQRTDWGTGWGQVRRGHSHQHRCDDRVPGHRLRLLLPVWFWKIQRLAPRALSKCPVIYYRRCWSTALRGDVGVGTQRHWPNGLQRCGFEGLALSLESIFGASGPFSLFICSLLTGVPHFSAPRFSCLLPPLSA